MLLASVFSLVGVIVEACSALIRLQREICLYCITDDSGSSKVAEA
jgi:hypothetical protein